MGNEERIHLKCKQSGKILVHSPSYVLWETVLSMKHGLCVSCPEPQLSICAQLKLEMSPKSHVNCALLHCRFEPKLSWVNEFQLKTLTINSVKIHSTILYRGRRMDGRLAYTGKRKNLKKKGRKVER